MLEGFNQSISPQAVTGKVEALFQQLLNYGLIAIAIDFSVIAASKLIDPFFAEIAFLIAYFFTALYFIYAFVLYKKLVLVRRTKRLVRSWKILNALIIFSLLSFVFQKFDKTFFINLNGLILMCGSVLILIIIINNRWIAFIDKKTKILSVFYLFVLILIAATLARLTVDFKLQKEILNSLLINEFIFLVAGFYVAYNVFALLTLLFNWPLFNALDGQLQSIKDYQEINRKVISQGSFNELYTWFLEACNHACNPDAAWVVNLSNNTILQAINADEGLYEEYKKILKPSKINNHHYYPDLQAIAPKSNTPYTSALVIELENNGKQKVAIFLLKTLSAGFDKYMIDLANSYADQVRLMMESINLFDQNITNERIKSELEIAKKVQKELMPKHFPDSNYFDLCAFSKSASEVGGDYFDFIELDDYRLATIVADVSGSGTSAAFYMAELKGIFQSLIQLNLPADMFLEFCNEALGNCLERSVFITLTYCLFDFRENRLTYGRAGHTPVLFYSSNDRSAMLLKDEGMGLGIIRNRSYSRFINIYERKLNPGDVYVMFTDGMTEAKNDSGEEFGDERLRFSLDKNHFLKAKGIVDQVIDEYEHFGINKKEQDDRSLLVIKIK